MAADLRVARSGNVATLTIDPPARRNATTAGMWAALPGVLAPLAADPAVRVLLVTGEGPSSCAGADISDLLGGADPQDPMADLRRDDLAAQAALRAFPAPRVAVIRGHCVSRSGLGQRATEEVLAALTEGDDDEAVVAPRYRETIASEELAEGVLASTERRVPRFPRPD